MIDERGRLFGKINIIDFLIILFLFCLTPMFYFGHKIMTKKPPEAPKMEFMELELNCRVIKINPELLPSISVGDQELNNEAEVIGEITSLGQSTPYIYEVDLGEEQKISKEDPILEQLKAKLTLKAEIRKDELYYKDKVIKINLPLEFKTNKYVLTAVPIVEVETEVVERKVDLYVTLKELDEDTLKKVSVGDKDVNENGEVMAEILSLGKIENSSVDFNLGSGIFVQGQDSTKKQISTQMRLRCLEKDGSQFYFKGKEMKHRTVFEFNTDKYTAKAMLAKTFEVISPLKEKKILLQVKFTGITPEIASVVQKDDVEKDPFEKIVARISSIIDEKPSQVLTLKEDEFITLNHPFNRDILITLEVLCIEKEGTYYFKNYPVKMGNNLAFCTDLYSITGLIVGMEIK